MVWRGAEDRGLSTLADSPCHPVPVRPDSMPLVSRAARILYAAARTHGSPGGSVGREHSGHQAEEAVELVGGVGAQIGDGRVGCAGGDKQGALRGVSGGLAGVPDHAGRDHGVALAGHEK